MDGGGVLYIFHLQGICEQHVFMKTFRAAASRTRRYRATDTGAQPDRARGRRAAGRPAEANNKMDTSPSPAQFSGSECTSVGGMVYTRCRLSGQRAGRKDLVGLLGGHVAAAILHRAKPVSIHRGVEPRWSDSCDKQAGTCRGMH